jgi:excisionase family DNA binding protein
MDTYSVKEIADMLNTNPETVRRWIRSGKLEANQESRKGGNVVTKSMLDAFLKNSPKYTGIATGLLSPVGLTTATAAIVGSIIVQQLIKNDEIKNSHVNTSEIKNLLFANIQTSRKNISRKKKNIKHLQEEILDEQARIDEAEKLIKMLEKNLEIQED